MPSTKALCSLLLPLCTVFAVGSTMAQGDFICPDVRSQELLWVARGLSKFGRTATGYRYVIENATRPMDETAQQRACIALATRYFRTNCPDYGYECPPAHNELQKWPALINDWVDQLKENHPILQNCPDRFIDRDTMLPTRRVSPVISEDMVAHAKTGWVELALDIDARGLVDHVALTKSSSPLFEQSAIDAASRFKYRPPTNEDHVPTFRAGVKTTIFFLYEALAKKAGCPELILPDQDWPQH